MAKEWANKDRYNPPHGVPESRMPLSSGKAIVRTVPTWGDKSALGGRDPTRRIKSVRPVWKPARLWTVRTEKPVRPVPKSARPVWRQQGDQLVFVLVMSLGSGPLVVV
jgi:hypothetical protein